MTLRGLLIYIPLLLSLSAQAAPEERNTNENVSGSSCVNKAPEENRQLIASFKSNKDPLKTAYVDARRKAERFKAMSCEPAAAQKQLSILDGISKALHSFFSTSEESLHDIAADIQELSKQPYRPAPMIKKECISASLKRAPGNVGHTCSYPNSKQVKQGFKANAQSVANNYEAGGDSLQCINDDMLDYISFAVNSAIQCLSPTDNPIDSRVIFQKFNNETAFNFTIGYSGGVGLGQITTPAAKEVSSDIGKGQYLLESVANSPKKACAPFKRIATQDLKKAPSTSNLCSWLNPGDGLARNLLHGVGYYLTMRDQYVVPALEEMAPKLSGNRELVSNLTAITYGAEGLKHAKWLLRKYRVNNKTDPRMLNRNIQKDSVYLTAIKKKTCEMYALEKGVSLQNGKDPCSQVELTPEEAKGDACVTTQVY